MSETDEIVAFEIDKPDPASDSKYILFITRGGGSSGMFSSSAPTTMFAVDSIAPFPAPFGTDYCGYLGDREVVVFSKDSSYLLVDRALVTPLTMAEMAKRQREATQAFEGPPAPGEDVLLGELLGGAQATPPQPGQYL